MAGPIAEAPVAVITGTTRDVGRFTAYGLAQARWNIIGLYRNPEHDEDQAAIVREIKHDYKVNMFAGRADLLDPATPDLVVDVVDKFYGGKINALVLNAAGGFSRAKDEASIQRAIEDARKINVDAQLRLVDRLLGKFSDGGVIVFNNSDAGHRIHRMGAEEKAVLEGYLPVAQTKNELEEHLTSRIPELAERGVRVAVAVGNALEGTFVAKVLRMTHKNLVSTWQNYTEENYFPTTMDMATAVVRCVRNNDLPSGHREYVGIRPELQLYPPRPLGLRLFGAPPMAEDSVLSREEVEGIIPQRWPFMFIGGVSEIEYGKRAVGSLVNLLHPDINWRDGHFPGHPLVPGTITQEALEQLGALTVGGMERFRGKIAVLRGVEMKFKRQITPGEPIQLIAEGMELTEARGMVFGEGNVRAVNSQGKPAVEGNVSFALLDPAALKAA